MPTIQIQHLSGPTAGRRLAFEKDVLHFGRSTDADIMISHRSASREHGELRLEGNQWTLMNKSRNGTRVNGRRVGKDGHVLANMDVVQIGDDPLFRVFIDATEQQIAAAPVVEVSEKKPKFSGKQKLWIGIAAYTAICLLFIVIVVGVTGNGKRRGDNRPAKLSDEQIALEIRSPIEVPATNLSRSNELIQKANEQLASLPDGSRLLHKPWHKYKQALAYAGTDVFDDFALQTKFNKLEEDLIKLIQTVYADAWTDEDAAQYSTAATKFKQLLPMFPYPDSTIYQNAEQHWGWCQKQ